MLSAKQKIYLKIAAILALGPLFVIAPFHIPVGVCQSEWNDSKGNPIKDAPISCPANVKPREVGGNRYGVIAGKTYRIDVWHVHEPATLWQCMTGVACIPIPIRARTTTTMSFTHEDSDPDIGRLRALGVGDYMTDGRSLFSDTRRVTADAPPVNIDKLKMLTCPSHFGTALTTETEPCAWYASDGHYVLYGADVVEGADLATFRADLPVRELDTRNTNDGVFARDRNAVYVGATRLAGADPATFGAFKSGFPDCGRICLIDAQHTWRLTASGVEEVELSPEDLAELRKALQETLAKRAMHSSP
ncbi:hypothetical protein [Massilia orientalis]|uniref:Uncharacterized protein n=1 Tax=Massilia orientalis TaxID=3050128 RepID=A0ACC7MG27_9BURK|nr:hypothetical protein [Massilia sp. YIM B02787]